MNATLSTVLVLLAGIFLIIWLLVRIHDRDNRNEDKQKPD